MQPTKKWVNQVPLRIRTEVVGTISGLSQFQGIPDETLSRIARQRSRVHVADRWAAIRMLISNPCPIPVVDAKPKPRRPLSLPTPPPRLTLIRGGRISR
jgi:hypothetical protein